LPVSTGPNALAYATSLVRMPRMIRSGILLDISGAIAIWIIVRVFSNEWCRSTPIHIHVNPYILTPFPITALARSAKADL